MAFGQRGRQQGLGVRTLWCGVHRVPRSCFYPVANIPHRQMGAEIAPRRQIIGDHDIGQLQPVLQAPQEVENTRQNGDI